MRLLALLAVTLAAACGSVATNPDATASDAPPTLDGAAGDADPSAPDAPPGTPDAALPPDAELPPKLAFVTGTVFIGGSIGGLDGADAKCQTVADGANLPGLYKAWLSDSTGSPSTRFTQYAGPYERVDSVRLANSWADLTDGTLLAPLDKTETGAQSTGNTACGPGDIWTNTAVDGTPRGSNDCADWTVGTGETASTGLVSSATSTWTVNPACLAGPCGARLPIYCFQQ